MSFLELRPCKRQAHSIEKAKQVNQHGTWITTNIHIAPKGNQIRVLSQQGWRHNGYDGIKVYLVTRATNRHSKFMLERDDIDTLNVIKRIPMAIISQLKSKGSNYVKTQSN